MSKSGRRHFRHRYPQEIVCHTVWLVAEVGASFREAQDMLAERGVSISHETIRQWCRKFSRPCTSLPPRRIPQPGQSWFLEPVPVRINGADTCLWRCRDLEGKVVDIFIGAADDIFSAKRFFRAKWPGLCYVPKSRLPLILANRNIVLDTPAP